jgi:hypothetical protein
MTHTTTNKVTIASTIVAAHAAGKVRHFNGGQCFIDGDDGTLILTDTAATPWTMTTYPAEHHFAASYRAATPTCRAASLTDAVKLDGFYRQYL